MITGTANLPLHSGKAPYWLMKRMKLLSKEIVSLIIDYKGEKYFFQLISNPYWFQCLGNVLGFDWHSSGLTTTVTAALKSINQDELGIKVAGGKGKSSYVQKEIEELSEDLNLNSSRVKEIKYASRMSAKVDNVLLQDSFDLYHHTIFFSKKYWAVVQQGKNNQWARRYHWLSNNVKTFVLEPHTGIQSEEINEDTLDMTYIKNKEHQKTSLDIVKDNPKHIFKYFKHKQLTLNEIQELNMPRRHWITSIDLDERTKKSLEKAYELQPKNYEELVAIKGIGKKSIRALALVSELVYGSPLHWRDPAKYSYAHGGKDGTPYPVDKITYDDTISILKEAIEEAKLGKKDKLNAIKRLHRFIDENYS